MRNVFLYVVGIVGLVVIPALLFVAFALQNTAATVGGFVGGTAQ